jgi:hypothetical protein
MERSEFDMERSENAALDSSTPSEPQFDCLANSLVQLLETAKYRSNTGGSKQQSHWRRQLVHEVRKVLLPERRKIIACCSGLRTVSLSISSRHLASDEPASIYGKLATARRVQRPLSV